MLPAGSESWSEGAETLSTRESDAADVQVSVGSCSPSWLHISLAVLVLFAISGSHLLSLAVLQL